jgi:pilus assembly protein CpaC
MHRTIRVPRSILLAALCCLPAGLGLSVPHAAAQEKAQEKGQTILVPINGSQTLEMSKKQRIKSIDNSDQNIARVEFVQGSDYRKVMILGGAQAGLSRLVLTDNDGKEEAFTIVVELNVEFLKRVLAQAAPTANIQITQGTGGTIILTGTVTKTEDIDIVMRTAVGAVGDPTRVINGLRVGGVMQVQLDVVVAQVRRTHARNMGFSFIENGLTHFVSSTVAGPGTLASAIAPAVGGSNAALAGNPDVSFGLVYNKQSFLGFLKALRNENLAKLLAEPKLVTTSGRPAELVSGGEQAVPVLASGGAGGGAVSGIEFRPFGTTVRFLPIVLGNGKIYMEVEPQFTFVVNNGDIAAPIPGTAGQVNGRTTQRVQTSVVMEDGQTFAIGGIILHQVQASANRLPVLGDLPYVGFFFSDVTYSTVEEEMLILVTPHFVDPMACNQLPHLLPGQETRNPDDYELFLERILEAPRGPREVFQGCRYVPAYKNGPTGSMYPCPGCNGPRGACDIFAPGGAACNGGAACLNGGCQNGNGQGSNGPPPGAGASAVQPMPSAQQTPAGQPQSLPAISPQQLPVNTTPGTKPPHSSAPATGTPVERPRSALPGVQVVPGDVR